MALSLFVSGLRPWQAAAALLIAASVFMTQVRPAEAAIGVTFTLNDTTASANTNATLDITLENDLNPGDTITVTFPAGWAVQDGALTTGGAAIDVSGFTIPPTVAGDNAARTVTFTMGGIQPSIAPITVTFNPTAEIVNAPNGNNVTVLVDATGQAQGASAAFTITVGATAVTGVTISASPLAEHTATTVTVAFTPSAAGALAATNTVTVVMTGYTLTNGPIAITPTLGFAGAGALNGNVTGGNTVTVTLDGTRTLAALAAGAFTFPATNPAAGTVAAAGLTVRTSQDTTNVQSGAAINVTTTAVTGVTISAAPLTAASASTITVAFTPTATGALAATNTVTVVMTGYTLANGAIVITPSVGFAGTLSGNVTGGDTVTVTLDGGATLAASTPGAFTFPATNPAAGAVAAAGLTVRTSRNTANVPSSADIVIVAAPLPTVGNSTVTANPTSIAADNATTSTITVTLLTAGLVPVGGKTVTLAQSGGGVSTISAASGASSGAGVVTFTVRNATAQAVTYTATIVTDGVGAITQTATVTFTTPAPPEPQNDPDPGPGGGGGPPIFFPVTCNAGSYNDNGTCVPAPPGSFVALSGASSPTLCTPGTYQDNSGMMFCFQVPAGSFTSGSGAIAATPWTVCPTGQAVVTEGTATSDRVCGQSPRPKITALALAPMNSSGALDTNIPFSDWPRANLTGGQTTFTLTVVSGRSYGVAAQADSGDITYRRGGIVFDPASIRVAAGDTVTVQAVNSAGTSDTYTLTLSSSEVVCFNGGVASNGFCVCPAGFSGAQCEVPQLTNAAITLSSSAASATAVTATITLKTPVAVPAGGKVKVSTNGVTFTSSVATFTSPSAVANTASFAGGVLTVTLPAGMPASDVAFTVTGGTNPGAQAAVTTGAMSVTNSADAVLASTSTGTMVAITGGTAVTAVTISAAPLVAGAPTTITAVAKYTTALNAADTVTVKLTGYTFEAGARTVTAGTGITGTLTGSVAADALDTVVLTGGSVAAGASATFTFPATNPSQAGAVAATALTLKTSKDTTPVASSSGFTITPGTAVTAVTISAAPLVAGAPTTITAVATYTTALTAADQITVKLTGYTFEAGARTVTAGTGITGTLTGSVSAGALDTVVLTGASVAAGSSATFTFPATNPAAGTIAATGLTLRTSKDTTPVASSAGFTIAGAPEITGGAITLSSTAPSATGVIVTMQLRAPVAIPRGGKITVTMPGFTWPTTPSVVVTPRRSNVTIASASFASNVLTITTANADHPANSLLTLEVSGATNPSAPRAARTDVAMSVRNSADAVLASTNSATLPAIGAALSVSIAAPSTTTVGGAVVTSGNTSTLLARPAAGSVDLTTTTTGLGGATASYAWTTTGAGCSDLVGITNSSNLSVFVADTPITCTFTVTVTAGSQTATASHAIAFTVAGEPRLEFTSQPTGSTTGTVDLSVGVRVLNADGSVNTDFTGDVTLSARAAGLSYRVGNSRVSNGVAQFDRPWTPQIADATWVLEARARASGYDVVTSNEFRVTKPKALKFTSQPSGGIAGRAFTTQPVVTAVNPDGSPDASFTGTVTLTLKSDTANGATLTATSTAAVAGVATFTGASINNAGTGYVLVASATGYAEVASQAFDVTGPATKLVFTQYPAVAVAGAALTTDVRVEVRDANDRPVPGGATGPIELLVQVPGVGGPSTNRVLLSAPSSMDGATAVFSGAVMNVTATGSGFRLMTRASLLRDEVSVPITVTGAPSKLVFVQQPGGWGASPLGTQPIVEIQDAQGNRVPGATNAVTLTLNSPAGVGWVLRPAAVAAEGGRATFSQVDATPPPSGATLPAGARFTLTANAEGLTSATSTAFGPPGLATKLVITSSVPSTLKVGEKFSLTVAVTDAAGSVNLDGNRTVTLAESNAGTLKGLTSVQTTQGVATFTGLYFVAAGNINPVLTAAAAGLTSATTSRIAVTAATQPVAIAFDRQPTHEATGATFVDQPRVKLVDATGATFTTAAQLPVSLTLHKEGGTTTASMTAPSATANNGVASFSAVRVSGADTGLYLKATYRLPDGTTLTANSSTFRVHADPTSATTARAAAQTQSVQFKVNLAYDSTLVDNAAKKADLEAAIKKDLCLAANLGASKCPGIHVTLAKSVLRIEDGAGQLLAIANVDEVDGEVTVTIGSISLVAFQAETGATAPAGTDTLYAIGRVAFDAWGNRLDVLPSPRSFSLPVPEEVVLLGTRPGDLKIAVWDGERWAQVPSSAVVEPDGSFTVTATTDALGVFAVLYAPGAARIQGVNGFSDSGAAFAVFDGGSAAVLSNAAGLNDANGVWVQDARGQYRLLVVGGPAFLADEFASHFTDGIPVSTAVTLMQTRTAQESTGGAAAGGTSATSYTVTGTDTLSGIGARFGVDWMRIAAANGIAGPNYLVRAGQTLTIPAR